MRSLNVKLLKSPATNVTADGCLFMTKSKNAAVCVNQTYAGAVELEIGSLTKLSTTNTIKHAPFAEIHLRHTKTSIAVSDVFMPIKATVRRLDCVRPLKVTLTNWHIFAD
jgi:3,4-dihydroxy-2-butanone 4-phosphate synthase